MKTSSRNTLKIIMEHKDHFDQKLVNIVKELQFENENLNEILCSKNNRIFKLQHDITGFKSKNSDLSSVIYSLKEDKKNAEKTIEDFEKALKKMQEEIDRLYIENEKAIEEVKNQKKIQDELLKKIKKLESTNSTNSNMPSSFDICSHTVPKEKKTCNSREKSSLSRGGQIGHKVHKSKLSSSVDEIKNLYVKSAPKGAEEVKDDTGNILYYCTHEKDLIIKTKTIETRYYIVDNGKELSEEDKKKYKINPVTYTPHFKSTIIYLNQRGTIPYARLSEILMELSNNEINILPSTMVKWSNEFSEKSKEKVENILKEIKENPIINVDETGLKINGKQNWIHTITNNTGTYYVVTESRLDKENGPIALLSDYDKTIVHDHYKPYYGLNLCKHGECNAHIERYLQEGIDFEKNESCERVKRILQEALQRKHDLENKGIHEMENEEIEIIKNKLLKEMEEETRRYHTENPNISKKLEADYIKLYRRMTEYIEEHILFLRDFNVPYTNNAAERSCRKVKTKKNVSHQFVSKESAESYARAMTIIETTKQNKENVLNAIEKIMS